MLGRKGLLFPSHNGGSQRSSMGLVEALALTSFNTSGLAPRNLYFMEKFLELEIFAQKC